MTYNPTPPTWLPESNDPISESQFSERFYRLWESMDLPNGQEAEEYINNWTKRFFQNGAVIPSASAGEEAQE